MSTLSIPPMIIAGITLYVGFYHLVIYLRRTAMKGPGGDLSSTYLG